MQQLTVNAHHTSAIRTGRKQGWDGHILTVDPDFVAGAFPEMDGLALIDVVAANPDENMRFGPVLDVVGLRHCLEGPAFPGVSGPCFDTWLRTMTVLDHAALAVAANLPGIQEGIVDMSPEAACYSPFSRTHNLVCVVRVAKEMDRQAADAALRAFQCCLAQSLAAQALGALPDETLTFSWPLPKPVETVLPRVAAVYFLQGQGALRRTFVHGEPADTLAPRWISPLELLSGAVVSGNYVMCCNKTCTYIHNEHPVARRMLREHGESLDFAGVIMANEASDVAAKLATARRVAELAVEMGATGVVINQEGGGNADADIMLACEALEKAGVATVLLANEFAGADGRTPSLTQTTPEAGYIVSTGNNDQLVQLPPAGRYAGFPLRLDQGLTMQDALTLPLTRIYASTNQLGFSALSCESA